MAIATQSTQVLNFQEGFCRFWLKYESDIYGECCVRRKGGQAFSPYDDQCFPIFMILIFCFSFDNSVEMFIFAVIIKITIMTAIALKHETEGYWNLIKDAGYEVKLVLIKKLSDSIMTAVADKKARRKRYTADDFAGMWSDECFMGVDEMNDAIRRGRRVKSNRDRILEEL